MKFGFEDLKVYQLAYEAAMQIFHLSKKFPKEETYSLTDQVRRSSRSVCANIAEAYKKKIYPKHFVSKLSDSDAEAAETIVHLNFAKDCGYLPEEEKINLLDKYNQIGRMLKSMMEHPEKFNR